MLSKINEFVLRLVARFQSEAGQALAEYGLILALIAVVCILTLTALGLAISGKLGAITSAMP
jgi:pilus assembly protein Flp/PilA